MISESRGQIRVIPTGSALGADIEGIDLSRPMDDPTLRAVLDAWAAHQVLRFRGQSLDDGSLVAFSRLFGEPDLAPLTEVGRPAIPEFPEVAIISNIVRDGRAIGALGSSEALWHTDMSYNPEPPSASILYSLEVPPSGGDTSFANMYLAAEKLPPDLRKKIEGLRIKHDASTTSAGDVRRGFGDVSDPREALGAVHPIIRTHPLTKKQALFIGRRRNAYVEGLGLEDSERLLDRLFAHVANPDFVWTQRWRVGDVIVWDNRCVMHRREPFDPDSRRLLHRTQIKGDIPV